MLHCLLAIQRQAAADHTEFCVAVPLASPVRRIIELTGISRHVPVYPTLQQVAHGGPPPR